MALLLQLIKIVRDGGIREDHNAPVRVKASRSFSPAGVGVLPPVPPAGRGVARSIKVEPSLSARVTPCGYPGCACAPDLVAATARRGDERPAPVVGRRGTSAIDADGLTSSLQPVGIASASQPTLQTPRVLQAAVREQPTPVGLGRGTT